MADIVLINPEFDVSFWGMEHALPIMGKRANLPVACLPLLAALTPSEHSMSLIDENVEAIDFDRCARADIVGVTGMSVQRQRMKEILIELKRRGCFTVVGGPWITVQEDDFGELADVIFVGEAEETWPRFLAEWQEGRHESRYEQAQFSDMTKVPIPRFDLLKSNRYAFGSLQFSRGCPFQCEFCDIIVTFGRRPRLKTSAQVIAELEAIRKSGMQIVFVVDDNLIGNKRAIMEVLKDVAAWQRRLGYPLTLFTEASIDLADEPALMEVMVEANFVSVFVGIESPSEESLKETKKLQNLRKGGTLLEKVHRVQDAGIEVWCGMIAGFDSDDATIFERQIQFIQESRIPFVLSGLLVAIPKTPLHARLMEAGRIDETEAPQYGTNIIPINMTREELLEGFLQSYQTLYNAENYFQRTESLVLREDYEIGFGRKRFREYSRGRPFRRLAMESGSLALAVGLFLRLMRCVPDKSLRAEYRRRLWRFVKVHRRPGLVLFYLIHIAMHFHANEIAKRMAVKENRIGSYY